jgi:hypothetical protein
MHNTQGFAERFMGRNPIPATPNPLVNQTIAQLRFLFCILWISQTMSAMCECAMNLNRCAKRKRGAMFIRRWGAWQRSLMDAIQPTFGLLFDIGRANADCALPDPGTWACKSRGLTHVTLAAVDLWPAQSGIARRAIGM